ncbi:MAG: hypothetical protein V4627_10375 [Pseudomonadota bacterium]
MNTNLQPKHAIATGPSSRTSAVRASLAYLALCVFASLLAAACIGNWRMVFG